MPYLYCAAHGRGREDIAIDRQEDYRMAGEAVLLVHGPLKAGPHRCDECNATLGRGDDATLLSAIPSHFVSSSYSEDFAREGGRYFDMKRAVVVRYGAS